MVGKVTRHGEHKTIDGFAGEAGTFATTVSASRVVDQPPQYRRRTAGLTREPIPVTRQQGDFTGHYTEFGTARAATDRLDGDRRLVRQARQHLIRRAAKIDFDGPTAVLIKDQHRSRRTRIHGLFNGQGHLSQRPRCDLAMTFEGDTAAVFWGMHNYIRVLTRPILPGQKEPVNPNPHT